LFDQYAALSDYDQERVEIVVLTDNKKIMLGHKRNLLVEMAQGKYVVFVDDDDRIAEDYISTLLKATEYDADCISFTAEVSLNGEAPKLCYYSKDNQADYNTSDAYLRIPNHICCVKRDVSLKSSFPNVLYGEDAGYSKVLLPNIKTEYKIDKVLYYYDYNHATTETQTWRNNQIKRRDVKPIVDVVILSKADQYTEMMMTQRAIDSCISGANGLAVNVIVLEGGTAYYENALTISKNGEAFNYNKFANEGGELGHAEWLMIANNDLEFRDGWLHNLIAAGNDVVSPHEPNDPRQTDITENTLGDVCGKHFSGWCFMIKRSLWRAIKGFDTDVTFWCSDDVVIEQVKAKGVMPMIVKDSIVEHLVSATLRKQSDETQNDLKWRNVYIFNNKYGKDKFNDHPEYIKWVKEHSNETSNARA
jgi:hypothetical protein